MQLAAGVPAAGPLTATEDTEPSGPNVICAGLATPPATQARAAPITLPTAACTAPVDGRSGKPPALVPEAGRIPLGAAAGAGAGASATGFGFVGVSSS
jgi:hypothetical protein